MPLETQFAVEVQTGAIVVQDRTITGICHKREDRGAHLEGSVVTLWFAHTGAGAGVCQAIGMPGAYQATIRGLSSGPHLLRVMYIGDIYSDSYPRPQLEQQVTVP